jgi:hypothetical protein
MLNWLLQFFRLEWRHRLPMGRSGVGISGPIQWSCGGRKIMRYIDCDTGEEESEPATQGKHRSSPLLFGGPAQTNQLEMSSDQKRGSLDHVLSWQNHG